MYPNSKLARLHNEHEENSRKFFLGKDAEYFRIVLNFLRKGKVFTFDEEIFFGVRDLAKMMGQICKS
jgi:hypothetical protein